MQDDVGALLERERQLDLIAYLLVIALLAVTAIVAFTVIAGIRMPDSWLLNNPAFRLLGAALMVAMVAYVADQQRRLRRRLLTSHEELQRARDDISAAYDRISFAHRAAEITASLTQADGLRTVMADSLQHFAADAVAIVDDDTTLMTADGVDAEAARTSVLEAATEAARAGGPRVVTVASGGSSAVAAPVRVRGRRDAVAVIWRRQGLFSGDDLEGLKLVARIIEMGMENHALLDDVKAQLSGTLKAMVDLVERRCPNYIPQSMTVASYAVAVGQALGMTDKDRAELRLAAILHDIGMLDVPESILAAPRRLTPEELTEVGRHSERGADLARVANFGPRVQEAIRCHHERMDGSGYPKGLVGDKIPLEARILSVCDSYVAMISERPHRPRMSSIAAVNEIRAGAGEQYDPAVVREFVRVQSGQIAD